MLSALWSVLCFLERGDGTIVVGTSICGFIEFHERIDLLYFPGKKISFDQQKENITKQCSLFVSLKSASIALK